MVEMLSFYGEELIRQTTRISQHEGQAHIQAAHSRSEAEADERRK